MRPGAGTKESAPSTTMDTPKFDRVAVVGGGAMGSLFAYSLASKVALRLGPERRCSTR